MNQLGLGLDLVFKLCSSCRERQWRYAHGLPRRYFTLLV